MFCLLNLDCRGLSDCFASQEGMTALILASQHGREAAVKKLLQHHALVNHQDNVRFLFFSFTSLKWSRLVVFVRGSVEGRR